MEEFARVASNSELAEGACMLVEAGDDQVVLIKVEGEIFAYNDLCPHAEGPMSDGSIEGGQIECPWHGSLFNVKTGENTGPPASADLQRFGVRIEGDDVLVGPA